jgi:hypothetical protein
VPFRAVANKACLNSNSFGSDAGSFQTAPGIESGRGKFSVRSMEAMRKVPPAAAAHRVQFWAAALSGQQEPAALSVQDALPSEQEPADSEQLAALSAQAPSEQVAASSVAQPAKKVTEQARARKPIVRAFFMCVHSK